MPTPVAEAARHVADHASAVAKLEVELALLELKKKVVALGLGVGLGVGAGIFALFMLGFAFAAVAAAFALFLPWWAALLVVTGILMLLVGLCGMLALVAIKKGTPPVPEQAIREAKLTSAAIKS